MSKVHVSLDSKFSLCGRSSLRGKHDIRTMKTFFQSVESDRCELCVHHLIDRGYSVTKLSSEVERISRLSVVHDRQQVFA